MYRRASQIILRSYYLSHAHNESYFVVCMSLIPKLIPCLFFLVDHLATLRFRIHPTPNNLSSLSAYSMHSAGIFLQVLVLTSSLEAVEGGEDGHTDVGESREG